MKRERKTGRINPACSGGGVCANRVVCESLEGRQLLSAALPGIYVGFSGGVLTILGTRLNDQISVSQVYGKNGKVYLDVSGSRLGHQLFRAKDVAHFVIRGGAGDDTIAVGSQSGDVVVVNGVYSYVSMFSFSQVTVRGVIDGGDGDDNITGGDGADTITGGNGNDYVNGGNGANVISGGDGDDSLHGGTGADSIDGGAGDDLLNGNGVHMESTSSAPVYTGETYLEDNATPPLATVRWTVVSRGNMTTIRSVANDNGSAVDTIIGGAGNDRFLAVDLLSEYVDKGAGDSVIPGIPGPVVGHFRLTQ